MILIIRVKCYNTHSQMSFRHIGSPDFIYFSQIPIIHHLPGAKKGFRHIGFFKWVSTVNSFHILFSDSNYTSPRAKKREGEF